MAFFAEYAALHMSTSSRCERNTARTPGKDERRENTLLAAGGSGATYILFAGIAAARCAFAPSVTRTTDTAESSPGRRAEPSCARQLIPSPIWLMFRMSGFIFCG